MGKKKFIDKKKSATFHLMARDTSDPKYSSDPSGDRVFVRVDNNEYAPSSSLNEGNADDEDLNAEHDSIFCDAPEGSSRYYVDNIGEVPFDQKNNDKSLPDHIRKEILELGFPDDGYNYLLHLREIRNAGAGSGYFPNPKAIVELLPRDIKAYDASKIELPSLSSDIIEENSIYNVASKAVSIRLQKALDPEVAALLDDSDSSKFGSDIEDLEEDFIIKANHLHSPINEEIAQKDGIGNVHLPNPYSEVSVAKDNDASFAVFDGEDQRIRRPLDEQFDLLEIQEYGSEDENECDIYIDEFETHDSLGEKLNQVFKDHPPDQLCVNPETNDHESPELTAEVIRRCKEYAEKYEDENHDEEDVLYKESSDESDVWDCETIVSTYSTFDNRPGKIGAPEARRKKSETLPGTSNLPSQKITLKGKESIPVDFLPRRGKHGEEKKKEETDRKHSVLEPQKKKPRSLESLEEKRERKSAVKSERREARRLKKETKDLYRSEAHHAQKVAAYTGPSSIPLK